MGNHEQFSSDCADPRYQSGRGCAGIAEALFATGLGLLAAIPAVIAYNKFTSDINRYVARLDYFADEFSIALTSDDTKKSFEFDKVFQPTSTQEEVFADTKRLVQSAVDG